MTLSDYIKEDLKTRIDSGRNLPEALTLTALAADYKVSLSPVREAAGDLIAEGYLSKSGNGRLAIARTASRGKSAAASSRARSSKPPPPPDWDATIEAEVIRLSMRRIPAFLREQATAERYGVGRTLIRQVFGRLAGRGLIEHVPRRGWRVRVFSVRDMFDYLEVREAMELKAMRLARPHLERADLARMLEGNPRPSKSRMPRLDNRLHGYLIARSGNRFIQEFFQQPAARYYTALFDRATPEVELVEEMAGQHREILEALLKKSWARAEAAMSAHIRAQGVLVEQMISDPPGRGGG